MDTNLFILFSVVLFLVLSGAVIFWFYQKQRKILVFNRRGLQYKDWEMWDEAVCCFQKALDIDPEHALTHYNLGFVLYYGRKTYDAAQTAFEKAIAADAGLASAHYALGHLYLHAKKDREKARLSLQTALHLNPSLAEACNSLGLIHIAEENWQDARDCFQKAVEINPRFATAHCNLAIASVYQGHTSEAVRYARTYAELQPESVLALKNLGNIYGSCGRRKEAVHELLQARARAPEDWIIHFWLGCLFLQQHTFNRAVTCFYEALRLHREFALAHYNLALCYEGLGLRVLAKKHIDLAIELNPELGKDLI